MWNQETDRTFLELREDAVLLFEQDTLKLLYLNPAARKFFPQADAETVYADLFQNEAVDNLLKDAVSSGSSSALTLDEQPWFPESAVIHVFPATWESAPAIIVMLEQRAYGLPPEALQMMKAVLTSAYFTAMRIDLKTKRASLIMDKNPLMNAPALFPDYNEFIAHYAAAVIHPEDRASFLTAFSAEQLRLFLAANTSPTCTVRRLTEEEYRWASFTLAAVNQTVVLLLGKDSNEQYLQQERSDLYRDELAAAHKRNHYIISGVSDIFRLMLWIDLKTGEAVLCTIHPDLEPYFSYEQTYQFEALADQLMNLVHPDDREQLHSISRLSAIQQLVEQQDYKRSVDYRRVAPQQDPNVNAKWTRSVFTLTSFENGVPTEAIFAVQDIDAQMRNEIEAKRENASITEQFYTLIRHRYLWFIEHDYSKQISCCHRIANHMVMDPMECPFGQFFERMIMPHCHPEDYKKVALALMPLTAEEGYKRGKPQDTVEYRHKTENGWRYVRAEIFMQENEDGILHAMIYIADIDDAVRQQKLLTDAEHEQLKMRRKFDKIFESTYIRVAEIDIDADTIRHFHIEEDRLVPDSGAIGFQEFHNRYPERYIYPEQRTEFIEHFSFEKILSAAREHQTELKHPFLVKLNDDGEYVWCNIGFKFLNDENGKRFAMAYVENVNEDIQKRDAYLLQLTQARDQLLEKMRMNERVRIRRAHVFLNIASSFQLALNQIYGALDKMERGLPEAKRAHHDLGTIFTAYERLSAMTSCAKDLLLIENNQLPFLKEPTSLPKLLQRIRVNAKEVFEEKQIRLVSFSTNVTEEIVICDSQRLMFLIDNIFINVMRSLPKQANVALQLAENQITGQNNTATYEFSLVTQGDSISQDIQKALLRPIPKNDPMRSVEAAFFLNNPDYRQYNLYLSKRLIALMNGTLEYVPLPNHAGAVILRLPFPYVPKRVLFPLRKTFGKRALIWDSKQAASISTIEILRESGMQSEWQADFEGVHAYLTLAHAQHTPFDLLVIRQTDLTASPTDCLAKIRELDPETPIFIIADDAQNGHPVDQRFSQVYPLDTPVFRSTVAKQLWTVFGEPTAPEET